MSFKVTNDCCCYVCFSSGNFKGAGDTEFSLNGAGLGETRREQKAQKLSIDSDGKTAIVMKHKPTAAPDLKGKDGSTIANVYCFELLSDSPARLLFSYHLHDLLHPFGALQSHGKRESSPSTTSRRQFVELSPVSAARIPWRTSRKASRLPHHASADH